MKPKTITYTAVFRADDPVPVALFRDPSDVALFHQNPAVYKEGRRRVRIGEPPILIGTAEEEAGALEILRGIVLGDDRQTLDGIEAGQRLLQRIAKETVR